MLPQLNELLSRQTDRVLARQTSQVETAKLLVTFSLSVAATLVATALQVGSAGLTDLLAAVLLAIAFGYTVWTIGLDNLQEPDRASAEVLARQEHWPEQILLAYVTELLRHTETFNETVAKRVKNAAKWQLGINALAGIAAAISLLVPMN